MNDLAIQQENLRYGFSDEQICVIKATIAPGVSDAELALFLMVCQKSGLDPFSRQIYLNERTSSDGRGGWVTKRAPETTIDGFRVIAERSGKYAGQTPPMWCGQDAQWRDVWLATEPPSAAKVGVLRTDFAEPIYAVALYSEYVQKKKDGTPNSMWLKMAANQLAKCAESLALRKAFPRDLSGFYSREEMGQAEATAIEAREDVKRRKLAEIKPKQIEGPGTDVGLPGNPSISEIEHRHSAQVAETQAVIEETEANPKPKRKRGSVSFEALKHIGEMKDALRQVTGTDAIYYEMVEAAGVKHADELTHEAARVVYSHMQKALAKLRADKATREEFQAEASRLGKFGFEGPKRFSEHLSAMGFASLDAVIEEASAEQVTALLTALRAL